MPFTSAPLNVHEPMVDRQGRPSKTFIDWITALQTDVDQAPARLHRKSLANQSASIGATALETQSLSAGLYRVSVYARVVTPATTSSSLIPTITFTDETIACSQSGDAMTSNSVTAPKSWTFLVRIDAASPISYSTTYASVGATAMVYDLEIVVEQVSA